MSRIVLRGLLLAGMMTVLVGVGPRSAGADTDLGQVCVNLAPFDDTVLLALTQSSGSAVIIDVNFRWRAGTPYQVGGAGVITESLTLGSFDLALNGTHNTSFFNNNKICALYAVLSPPSFGGPWQATCVGSGGAPFTASGTVVIISCPAGASAERTGRGVGE